MSIGLVLQRRWAAAVRVPPAAIALSLVFGSIALFGADVAQGPIRGGFSVAEADGQTGERKYALRGESAIPLSADEWEIRSPQLELYGAGGTTNLVFRPNRCFFDRKSQQITSREMLEMWTGDGHLRVQGMGFSLDLEGRRLWISNQVEAVVSKATYRLRSRDGSPRMPLGLVQSADPGDVIQIRSDRLEYGSDRAEFLGGVRAEDSQGALTCGRLAIELLLNSGEVEAIQAEEDVRLLAAEVEASASRVLYRPAQELLELTGAPRWTIRGRPGRADRLVLNRNQRSLSASGDVQIELPGGSFALPAGYGLGEAADAPPSPVKVTAGHLDFMPVPGETNRNSAVFRDQVVVEQGEGRLQCSLLTVKTEGKAHSVKQAQAEQEVTIARGNERFTCARAEYDAAGAWAEFTGGTTWQSTDRSGSADRVWLDLSQRRYEARGRVRMQMQQSGEAWAGWLAPAPGPEPRPETAVVAAQPSEPVEIECDQFTFRAGSAPGATEFADYEGNVSVSEGDRFQLTCASLRAQMGSGANRMQSVVADDRVEIRVTEGGGYRLARGDRAVYLADDREVLLTGRDGVEFFIIAANGVSRGVGRQAVYRGGTDTLTLAGNPMISTPEGELTGREVRLDRRNSQLSATGPWEIRLPLGGLELPQLPVP